MLSLFSRANAKILQEKRMLRVINSTFTSMSSVAQNGAELRSELRSNRNIGCLVIKLDNSREIVDCWPCITVDLSSRGSLVFVTKPFLEQEKYIYVLSHDKEFVAVQAKCVRCNPNQIGGYRAGFQFMGLIDLKGFLAIKLLLEMLSGSE
ncbi:MAG: PilZ domain-containing protein [Pirellula sp.]